MAQESQLGQGQGDDAQGGPPRRRFGGGGGSRSFPRRKVCAFCVDGIKHVDYKDVPRIRRFVSDRGMIEPRRKNGNCAKHQRSLAIAIKRARHLALLSFTEGMREPRERGGRFGDRGGRFGDRDRDRGPRFGDRDRGPRFGDRDRGDREAPPSGSASPAPARRDALAPE